MHFRLVRSKGIFTWHCYGLQSKSGWSRTSMNTIASHYQAFQKKNEGKRYSKAPSDTLRERKEAYMHPKSADEVFVRVPDSLSEVTKGIMSPMNARQHPRETKSGGKRFPRVQAALLRSKRGRKCYRRDSEQA